MRPLTPPAEVEQRVMAAVARESFPRTGRLERVQAWLACAGAAALLIAAGWAAGRFAASGGPGAAEGSRSEQRRLAAALIERDLWRQMAPSGAVVMPLDTDGVPGNALVFASVAGDTSGFRVRVVATRVPAPPRGMVYQFRASTQDGAWRAVGELRQTSVQRWEFSGRIDIPPDRLDSLEVRLVPAEGVAAGGQRVIAHGRIRREEEGGDW